MSPRSAFGRSSLHRVVSFVEGIGFWLAIVLPFLYVPLLHLRPPSTPVLLVGALLANAVALVIGHGYPAGEPLDRTSARPDG